MNRTEAIETIAKERITRLSEDEQIHILQEYWTFDCEEDVREAIEEGDLPNLDKQLIDLMVQRESPKLHGDLTDILLIDHYEFSLAKVLNAYLALELEKIGIMTTVIGTPEPAAPCPCCNYYSIDVGEDGLWSICPVCFWENGGDGPNHMTLKEAKHNFKSFGAISKDALKHIDPEGPKKYRKG